MLRPDVVVPQRAGFLLRKDDNHAPSVVEALEHAASLAAGGLRGLDLHDLELHFAAWSGDLDGLALLVADDRLADR